VEPHQHDVIHQIGDWVWMNIQPTLFFIGAVVGAVWWILHRTFATETKLQSCRREITQDVHDQFIKHERRESEQHEMLQRAIERLHQTADDLGHELGELKNLMIKVAHRDNHD